MTKTTAFAILAALFGGFFLGLFARPECPPVAIPADNTQKVDSAITAARTANERAAALEAELNAPQAPIYILTNERTKEFRGTRRDSLMGILDSDPRTE